MREFKFRAKVLNSNNWIYRQPFHIRGTWYMYNSLWDMVPIEYKTLGQYTGLKDKNGKEIFEGDIVKGKAYEFNGCPRIIGEVVYDYCEYKVKSIRESTHLMKSELNTTYEVIGNIYEHPHLLETK